MSYSGASRFSSSSSTSSRNMEVIVDANVGKNQNAFPKTSLAPPPSVISDEPPEESVPPDPYPRFISDLTESEFASACVPPPPPPSQHSRASTWTTSSRHSRSHHSCSHHHHCHHHHSSRRHLHPTSDSVDRSSHSQHYYPPVK